MNFGKSVPSKCVWLDGIAPSVTGKYLGKRFSRFGTVTYALIDRSRELALIYFDAQKEAQSAIEGMRGRELAGKVLQVKYFRQNTSG